MTVRLSILFISLATLGACNSDSDNSNSKSGVTVSGAITDAPMSNAKVCLDYNNNMSCDAQEPQAISGTNGQFEVQGVDVEKMATSPLVAEMGSKTVNEALGENLDTRIKLSAPAGCKNINFLTTMTQYFVNTNLTVEDAYKKTKNKVLTDQDICANYHAKSADHGVTLNVQEENQYLNQLSQHKSNLFAENMANLLGHYKNNVPSYLTMHRMLMAHAIDNLPLVIKNVTPSLGQQQNEPQTVSKPEVKNATASSEGNDTASAGTFLASEENIDHATLLDAIERAPYINVIDKYIDANEPNDAIHRLTDSFANKQFNLSYTRTISNDDSDIEFYNGRTEFFNWNPNSGEFEQGRRFEPSNEIIVSHRTEDDFRYYGYVQNSESNSSNWIPLNQSSVNENSDDLDNQQIRLLYKDSDSSYPATVDNGPSIIIQAKEIDVSNKNISMLTKLQPDLELWDQIIKNGTKFKPNTTALSLTVDVASVPFTRAPEGFSKCNAEQEIDKSCFEVSILSPRNNHNPFPPSLDFLPNVTLDYVDVGTGLSAIVQQSSDNIPSMPVLLSGSSGYASYATVYLESNGTARFYQIYEFSLGQSIGINNPFARTKWKKQKLFDNQEAITIELPNRLRRLYPSMPPSISIYEADGKIYFTGLLQLGDTIAEKTFGMDKQTIQQVIDSIDAGALYNLNLYGR